jgi:hypothetical protein
VAAVALTRDAGRADADRLVLDAST